eukprot:TRINITY_DN1751_c0_g1_i4.p1 TRINITY_DN1751_c0_g1~~TRINITY_DN1751_c0_g1_i4.p1  ORF type:complete len:608 (+),score=140.22 TRINITY_DN1751_c0_g1_i4:263-2086(+)
MMKPAAEGRRKAKPHVRVERRARASENINMLHPVKCSASAGKKKSKVKAAGGLSQLPPDKADKGDSNIRVSVRVRPIPPKHKGAPIVRVLESKVILVLDPAEAEEDYLRLNRTREKQYAFDTVFDTDSKTRDVFAATCSPLVDSVMSGVNATVFAYGPTGAGKTYTMTGTPEEPGVMVLALQQMFQTIEETREEILYKVSMSYIEVYNENIRDLIAPHKGVLDLREDPIRGSCVAGVTEHTAESTEEVLTLLIKGNRNRVTESTSANNVSSRSHAVLQITVEQRERVGNIHAEIKVGKLSMIDLAGSERATVTDNRGIRMLEGSNINRSLLSLANCINALGSKNRKGSYVPYRDSKLTRLLKDSLGGNCKTSMITNVHSMAASFEETTNTLKYASRAKKIKMVVSSNITNVEFHISEYQKIIAGLREEVFDLKRRITDDDDPQDPELHVNLNQTAEEAAREALIRQEALEASQLGACTIRTKEALLAMEQGESLTPDGNKRVLERWKLERENSELELVEMQALKSQITVSFQERIQTRRMLFEIEDKNMQNKADVEWRNAQIEAYERCGAERPSSSLEAPGDNESVSPDEEPSSIRNLRREVDVYKR